MILDLLILAWFVAIVWLVMRGVRGYRRQKRDAELLLAMPAPPTDPQLAYIASLKARRDAPDLQGVEPENTFEASELIDALKQRPQRTGT